MLETYDNVHGLLWMQLEQNMITWMRVVEIAIKAGASTTNIPDTAGYTAPVESADLIRMLIGKSLGQMRSYLQPTVTMI